MFLVHPPPHPLAWIPTHVLRWEITVPPWSSSECHMCMLVAQSCLTLCDPTDCNPPGSSVHEILRAGILEWAASPFSRRSSQPRDRTWISLSAGRFFTVWAAGEGPSYWLANQHPYFTGLRMLWQVKLPLLDRAAQHDWWGRNNREMISWLRCSASLTVATSALCELDLYLAFSSFSLFLSFHFFNTLVQESV